MRFEEEYKDVLQNIEFAIVDVYRDHPELTDYDVADAIQALTRQYLAEATKRYPPYTNLSERANLVVQAVKSMCEWRLGRNTFETKEGEKLRHRATLWMTLLPVSSAFTNPCNFGQKKAGGRVI